MLLNSAALISKDGKAAILVEQSQLPKEVMMDAQTKPQFLEEGLFLKVQWALEDGHLVERQIKMTPLLWMAVQKKEAVWAEINEQGQFIKELPIEILKSA